jgi:hypothetical protein
MKVRVVQTREGHWVSVAPSARLTLPDGEVGGWALMNEIDSHIRTIEMIEPQSATAPSDILAGVAAFNADMMSDAMPGLRQGTTLGIPEKLKEWLDKLVARVRDIVSKLSDVASFSITDGSPFAVSVSITFARSQG